MYASFVLMLTLYILLCTAIFYIPLYPLLTYKYSFILYLYTKEISQYKRNIDVMSIFSYTTSIFV